MGVSQVIQNVKYILTHSLHSIGRRGMVDTRVDKTRKFNVRTKTFNFFKSYTKNVVKNALKFWLLVSCKIISANQVEKASISKNKTRYCFITLVAFPWNNFFSKTWSYTLNNMYFCCFYNFSVDKWYSVSISNNSFKILIIVSVQWAIKEIDCQDIRYRELSNIITLRLYNIVHLHEMKTNPNLNKVNTSISNKKHTMMVYHAWMIITFVISI